MPRKPRIEIAGYYHVINRGVEHGQAEVGRHLKITASAIAKVRKKFE